MNPIRRSAVLGSLALVCAAASVANAQVRPPSQKTIDQSLAKGPANTGGPFDISVTGAKTGSVTGNDASFCVTSMGDIKIVALSLVATQWAVSISGMGDRPTVGTHVFGPDMTKTLTVDLTDKTTGPKPTDWVHSEVKSGTLTITKSDATKLSGTYEFVSTPKTGGEWRGKGKFEANPVKC